MDLDPDPAIFVIDLQDANKKLIINFYSYFPCLLTVLFEGTFTSFFKDKKSKIVGSGSGKPENMWIRWIRIRIRNTGSDTVPKLTRDP